MQPGIYAALYGATVASFPKAIFLLSAVLLYLAVCALMLVRSKINLTPGDGEYAPAAQDEDAVVEEEEEEDDDDTDVTPEEEPSRSRGRHERRRRSLSRHEIEETRQTSIARLSFSQD